MSLERKRMGLKRSAHRSLAWLTPRGKVPLPLPGDYNARELARQLRTLTGNKAAPPVHAVFGSNPGEWGVLGLFLCFCALCTFAVGSALDVSVDAGSRTLTLTWRTFGIRWRETQMPLDSVLALRLETKRVAKPKAANPRRKAKQPNAYTIILATPERDYDLFTATSTRAKSNISALERLLGVSAELRNVAPVESDPATLLYPR